MISVIVTTTPKPRFKFATRKPFLRTTAGASSISPVSEEQEDDITDQTLESSNQKPRPVNDKSTSSTGQEVENGGGGELPNSTELADIALSLHSLQTAPLPSTTTTERMPNLYGK